MKTAVEYRQAVLRGWRLVLLLAFLGAAVGMVRPVHNASSAAQTWIGTVQIEGKKSISYPYLVLNAQRKDVATAAARSAGIPHATSVFPLVTHAGSKQLKGVNLNAIVVDFAQPSQKRALALARAYPAALQAYLTNDTQTSYDKQVTVNNALVTCLQNDLSTVDDDISSELSAPGSVDASSIFGGGSAGANCNANAAASNSSTSNSSTAALSGRPGPHLVSTVSSTTAPSPTAPAPNSSTATPGGGTGTQADSGRNGSSTYSNVYSGDATLAALEVAKVVLTGQLHSAVATQANLSSAGPPTPTIEVLQPAAAIPETTKAKSSITNSRGANLIGGFLLGALLAAGIVIAVETLDKSLRSSRQVEQAFDLPVVGEIPLPEGWGQVKPGDPPPPVRLDAALDPTSAIAEAYRHLRTATLIEPLAAERMALESALGTDALYLGAGSQTTPALAAAFGNGNGHGNGHGDGAGDGTKARRRVIMTVSANGETTRASVIANLAATFAQAGERALVVTVGNLSWNPAGTVRTPPAIGDDLSPRDIVPMSSPTMLAGVRRLAFDRVLSSMGQVASYGPAVIAAAREAADVVLVDGLSLLDTRDSLVLLSQVDALLVVAEWGRTSTTMAKQMSELLRRFSAPVMGVVFTNMPPALIAQQPHPPAPDTEEMLLYGEQRAAVTQSHL